MGGLDELGEEPPGGASAPEDDASGNNLWVVIGSGMSWVGPGPYHVVLSGEGNLVCNLVEAIHVPARGI